MDQIDPIVISQLVSPATWAAFVGAILATVLVIGTRLIERAPKIDNSWKGFVEKLGAVIGSMAAGLLAVQEDTQQAILAPILSSLLVVGIGVGFYRAIGDLVWKRPPDKDPVDKE